MRRNPETETDVFVETMSPAVQWIETYKTHIVVFIVLGLILLYFVTRYQTEIRNTNESATDLYETVTNDYLAATDKKEPMKIDVGSEALKEKLQKMNAPNNSGDSSLDATAALAQFNDLMDSESIYASTEVADHAKLIYGNFLYDNDRFTEAIEQYKAYIDAMTLIQDRIAGYEGIVLALEAQAMKKKTNQESALTNLLKKIEEIQSKVDTKSLPRFVYHEGRILQRLKKTKEATVIYQKVITVSDSNKYDNRFADYARDRLATLPKE